MMRRILFAITVLVLPAALSSQPTDWATVHELTVRGIDQLYNLEMEQAERTFDEVIRMAPNDAHGYFFKGMIHFWIFSLNKDPKAYARFFELADRVIAISERERARDKNDVVATFFLGGIYGYRGLAHQRNGSMLKAAWDGRKGYSLLKDAVTAKPDLYDAQMGFGLYSYLVGLEAAENKDNVPNSTYYRLGVCYDILGQRSNAVATYRRVRNAEPRQWDYHYFRRSNARVQLPMRDADVLLVKAENAASLDDHHTAWALYKEALKRNLDTDQLALALYGVAQAHNGLQQYEEAIEAARVLVALKPPREQWVVPHGYYVLGQALARQGEVSEARKAFEAVGRFKNYDFQSRLQAQVEREMRRLDGAG
jgi:tetratricopeptide (TPR) repeat protein